MARTAKTIRMRPDVYHRARVAAVVAQKSLGQWIEEAIVEKVERDAPSTQQSQRAGDLTLPRANAIFTVHQGVPGK